MTESLTTRQAAAALNLHPVTLKVWRRTRNDGPPYFRTLGGKVRYQEDDLRRWIESRKEEICTRAVSLGQEGSVCL